MVKHYTVFFLYIFVGLFGWYHSFSACHDSNCASVESVVHGQCTFLFPLDQLVSTYELGQFLDPKLESVTPHDVCVSYLISATKLCESEKS